MKKRVVVLLFSVFLTTAQCFPCEGKVLATKQQDHEAYEELIEAHHQRETDKTDKVIDSQPVEKAEKDRECCVSLERCTGFFCEKYFKVTFVACSLFLIEHGIVFGFI